MRSDLETEVTVWDKPVSWGSIVGGAIVAIGMQVVLTLLGMGIGLVAVNPAEEPQRLGALGAGAVAWWFVTGLGSLFFGGWVAGRLSSIPAPVRGMLHGLISWGLV